MLETRFIADLGDLSRGYDEAERRQREFARAGASSGIVDLGVNVRPLQEGLRSATRTVSEWAEDAGDKAKIVPTLDTSALDRGLRDAERKVADLGGNYKVSVSFELTGDEASMARLEAFGAVIRRLNGQDVDVDVDVDRDGSGAAGADNVNSRLAGMTAAAGVAGFGLGALSGKMDLFSGTLEGLGAQRLPLTITGLGGVAGAAASTGAAVGALGLELGKGAAGFAAIGGAAAAAAYGGVSAYAALIGSAAAASREAYFAMNEGAQAALDLERNNILATQASAAFNAEINDSALGFARLQAAVGNAAFPYFTRELDFWNDNLAQFTPQIANTAGAISAVAANFSEFVRTAQQGRLLGDIFAFINTSAVRGAVVLGDMGRAGLLLFQQLIGPADRLQVGVMTVARAFSSWVGSAEGARTIEGVIANLEQRMYQLIGIAADVGRGLGGIFSALQESGAGAALLSDIEGIASGFSNVGAEGSESRATIISFAQQGVPLLRAAGGVVSELWTQFVRVADATAGFRAEGSKTTVLVDILNSVKDAAGPVADTLIDAFEVLGPSIPPLIDNLSDLFGVFAGQSPVLKAYLDITNQVLDAFLGLPQPVQDVAANVAALGAVAAGPGGGGGMLALVSAASGLYLNFQLLKVVGAPTMFAAIAGAVGTAATSMWGFVTAQAAAAGGFVPLLAGVAAALAIGAIAIDFIVNAPDIKAAFTKTYADSRAAGADVVSSFGEAVDAGLRETVVGDTIATYITDPIVNGIESLPEGALREWVERNTGFDLPDLEFDLSDMLGDTSGLSSLWTQGIDESLGELKTKLMDSNGLSGAVDSAINAIPEGALREKLESVFGFELPDFEFDLSEMFGDTEGISSLWTEGVRKSLADVGQIFTDDKGVSGRVKTWWAGIGESLKDDQGLSGVWQSISQGASTAWNGIAGVVRSAGSGISSAATAVWNAVRSGATSAWNGLRSVVSSAWNGIRSAVTSGGAAIRTAATAVWNGIRTAATTAWNAIRTVVTTVWRGISTAVRTGGAAIRTAATAVWTGIRTAATTAWNAIRTVVTTVWRGISTAVRTGGAAIRTAATAVWTAIRTATTTAWNGIRSVVTTVWNGIRTAVRAAINFVRQIVQTGWNAVRSATQTVWNAIRQVLTTVWNAIRNLVRTATANLRTTITTVWNAIRSATQTVWQAIRGFVVDPITQAVDTGISLVNRLRDTLGSVWEGIKSGTQAAWTAIAGFIWEPIRSAYDQVVTWINNIIDVVNGILEEVGIDPIGRVGGSQTGGTGTATGTPTMKRAARGGVFAQDATGGVADGITPRIVYGEAGAESYVTLDRYTPESAHALAVANETWMDRGWLDKAMARGGFVSGSGEGLGATHYDVQPYIRERADDVAGATGTQWNTYYGHGNLGGATEDKTVDFWGGARGTPLSPQQGFATANMVLDKYVSDLMYIIRQGEMWRNGGFSPFPEDPHYDHTHVSWGGPGGEGTSGSFNPLRGIFEGLWEQFVQPVVDRFVDPLESSPNVLLNAVGGLAQKVPDGIKEWALAQLPISGTGGLPAGSSPKGLTIGEALSQGGWPSGELPHASAIVFRESGGNADAQNPSGARGLMQIMPGTADGIGADYERLYDPVYNTAAGQQLWMQQGYSPWVTEAGWEGYTGHEGDPVYGYDLGGRIPGTPGEPVNIMAHAGEIVLPRAVSDSFIQFSRTLENAARPGGIVRPGPNAALPGLRQDLGGALGATARGSQTSAQGAQQANRIIQNDNRNTARLVQTNQSQGQQTRTGGDRNAALVGVRIREQTARLVQTATTQGRAQVAQLGSQLRDNAAQTSRGFAESARTIQAGVAESGRAISSAVQPLGSGMEGTRAGVASLLAVTRQVWGLASGAIVTRPTPAVIGERGAEAVVPLTGDDGRSDDLLRETARLRGYELVKRPHRGTPAGAVQGSGGWQNWDLMRGKAATYDPGEAGGMHPTILDAMTGWNERVGAKFLPNYGGATTMRISTGDPGGGWAGMTYPDGRIDINLAASAGGTNPLALATHELGHALGMDHNSANSIMNYDTMYGVGGRPTSWDTGLVSGRYGRGTGYAPRLPGSYELGGLIPGLSGDPRLLYAHAGEMVLPAGLADSFVDFAEAMRELTDRLRSSSGPTSGTPQGPSGPSAVEDLDRRLRGGLGGQTAVARGGDADAGGSGIEIVGKSNVIVRSEQQGRSDAQSNSTNTTGQGTTIQRQRQGERGGGEEIVTALEGVSERVGRVEEAVREGNSDRRGGQRRMLGAMQRAARGPGGRFPAAAFRDPNFRAAVEAATEAADRAANVGNRR